MENLQDKIIELMDLFDGEVTTLDKINPPEPRKDVQDIEAINRFMRDNPPGKADGGMLVKPSADGSRPGYAKQKYVKKGYFTGPRDYLATYPDRKPEFVKFLKDNNFTVSDFMKPGFDRTAFVAKFERGQISNKYIKTSDLAKLLVEKGSPYTDANNFANLFNFAKRELGNDPRENATIKRARKLIGIVNKELGTERFTLKDAFNDSMFEVLPKTNVAQADFQLSRGKKNPFPKRYIKIDKNFDKKLEKIITGLNKEFGKSGFREGTIDNIFNLFDDKKLMKELIKYKGGDVDPKSYLFKKVYSNNASAYAFMQLGRVLKGEVDLEGIKKNKVLGNKIIKSMAYNAKGKKYGPMWMASYNYAKLQLSPYYNKNTNYAALGQAITKAFKKAGVKNTDIDEIFPLRTGQFGVGQGSNAYSNFVQFIDREINQGKKLKFDSDASSRYNKIIEANKIGDFNRVNELVNEHDEAIKKFYKENPKAKNVKLTKLNYDPVNKRFLSPTEIYGKDVIPSKILKGMEKFYDKTGLSLDVGTTVTLEEAAEGLKGDKKSQAQILKKMGFKCKFAAKEGGLGKCDDPANYVEDINKTRADLNSNDVTVRAAANAKLNNSLKIAKTLPEIGTFLRRVGQATVGGVTSTLKALGLTTPVGYAIEGMVEGGVYDYFRKQGYTHDQAYAETFTPGIITGRPEGVPWYGGAESLLEKELIGDPQQNPKVAQYVSALKDQEQIYDAFADKQRGIKAQRKDITDKASADIQDAYRSGMVSRVNQIMNPESMASQAYQTAVEKQMGAQDQRARDYMDKNYVQREPSEFQQEQLQKERNEAMLELFPPPTVDQIRAAYTAAGYKDLLPLMKAEDYKKEMKAADDYQKQSYFADNFRLEKAGGGRAGFKLGSVRKGVLALIDDSLKKTPKDTTTELDKLIKKTLDEDLFDKKDRIIDNLNARIAKAKEKGLDSEEIGKGQIGFYDNIIKSNFRTKTGPFFDYQKRKNKAGGGLLKQAGDRSGAMLESMNPDSQGLPGLLKRVKKQ